MEKFYSFSAAAKMLGITRGRFHQWFKAGKFKKVKEIERPFFIRHKEFEKLRVWHEEMRAKRAENKAKKSAQNAEV